MKIPIAAKLTKEYYLCRTFTDNQHQTLRAQKCCCGCL